MTGLGLRIVVMTLITIFVFEEVGLFMGWIGEKGVLALAGLAGAIYFGWFGVVLLELWRGRDDR